LIGYSRFSPGGRWLALSSGTIRDAATGDERLHLPVESGKYLNKPIAFSSDGRLLAVSVWRLIKLPNGQRIEMLDVEVLELATRALAARLEMGGKDFLARGQGKLDHDVLVNGMRHRGATILPLACFGTDTPVRKRLQREFTSALRTGARKVAIRSAGRVLRAALGGQRRGGFDFASFCCSASWFFTH
jgi:hypothetical protein